MPSLCTKLQKWGDSSFWLNSKGQNPLPYLSECNSFPPILPPLSDGAFVPHHHFTQKSPFPLMNLDTTPLWTWARGRSFYPPLMINFVVVFYVPWHKSLGVQNTVFSLECVRKQEKPQALFSALEKAQPRIIHPLFHKGKVFAGVWGIPSVRMKMSPWRKWNEKQLSGGHSEAKPIMHIRANTSET